MSVSIRMACLKCKVALWIGQSSLEFDEHLVSHWESYLYTGEKKTISAFNSFLSDHVMRCHKVIVYPDSDGNPYEEQARYMEDYKPKSKKGQKK